MIACARQLHPCYRRRRSRGLTGAIDEDSCRASSERATSRRYVMRAGRPVALLLLLLSVLFTPLSYTDVPDQTWLGGLWDGGDNDDVILQLEATGATVDTLAVRDAAPVLVVVGFAPAIHEVAVASRAVSTNQTRAPPAR